MELVISIVFILSALLAGVVSPGPSFILVAGITMNNSRNNGIAASIGMGLGGMLFSVLALLGLHAILTNIPILYMVLKILGGLYLIYLALWILRGAKNSLTMDKHEAKVQQSLRKSFLIGFLTQITNPKTAIVYGSIFAAMLPSQIPESFYFILPPLVFCVEAGWYLLVSIMLSAPTPKAAYLRSKSLFDRLAGTIMAGLGTKLVVSTDI